MRQDGTVSARSQPQYFPVDGKPWRLAMGLRPLTVDRWIEVDDRREVELQQKSKLINNERSTVVATLPSSLEAQEELEGLVSKNLEEFHPGLRVDLLQDRDPIVRASASIQEDCCILEFNDSEWVLTAACVCFPSRWALTEKIGRDLTEIHAPVPRYDTTLASPVDAFFDRLQPGQPKWRLNWTVLDTDELHLPTDSAHRRPELLPDLGDLTIRVERQTLRKMEQSGAVVFTIRNYTTPLSVMCKDNGARVALLETLKTVQPDVAVYKGWTSLLEPLITWLQENER
jgi:hypothetical protein